MTPDETSDTLTVAEEMRALREELRETPETLRDVREQAESARRSAEAARAKAARQREAEFENNRVAAEVAESATALRKPDAPKTG